MEKRGGITPHDHSKSHVPQRVAEGAHMKYQLFLPHHYEDPRSADKLYPLILFLHGAGRRGDDFRQLDNYGPVWFAEGRPDFPYMVVTPQCPADSRWHLEYDTVTGLLDSVNADFRVDRERVYVGGFSMGGSGTWYFAARAPERFAAAFPMSGSTDPDKAIELKNVPIWAFHSEDDDLVPVTRTKDMVQALTDIGGNVRTTYYSGLKHSLKVLDVTFNDGELFTWLRNHKTNSRP
jgi:predicted peptidase